MSLLTRLLLGIVVVLMAGQALADAPKSILAEAFFQRYQFSDVVISPDGGYLALIGPVKGDDTQTALDIVNLADMKVVGHYSLLDQQQVAHVWWVTNTKLIFSTVVQTGSFDQPVPTGWVWIMGVDGKDPKSIITHGDVVSVLHQDGGNEGQIVLGAYRVPLHLVPSVPTYYLGKRDKNITITGISTAKDGGWVTVDNTGDSRLTSRFNELTVEPELFYRDRGTHSWDWADISSLIANEPRYTGYGPVMFTTDNQQFYYTGITPAGTVGLYLINPHTLKKTLLYSDPHYDIRTAFYSYTDWLKSYDGKTLVAFEYMADRPEWILLSQSAPESKLLAQLEDTFNGENVVITSAALNGSRVVFFVSSDRNPGAYYLYDAKNAKAQFLFNVLPGIDPDKMASMEPITFKARDGLIIHGYLTLPLGKSKNLPLIILPHGGPFGIRDEWGFNPEVQFFAYHGYAVLQVEFRGSGGYGDAFQAAGYRQWGGTMQDDLTDATQWAIKQGIADPNRICIYGASYGGYAAIEGVVKEPDLYKCAVGYAGVYDLLAFRSRAHTLYFQNEIPVITTELGNDENYLRAHSPVFNVDKIKAALFLAHGGADKTVPASQADELRDALDKAGKPYEWLYFRNEGHGFYRLDHKVELYTKMLAFFDKYIGYQNLAQ